MADVVYKRISDLDTASVPLVGGELLELSQGGVSKKLSLTSFFGSGWWDALRTALSSFKAPDATHADDADTVEGEGVASFHDATQLTGAVPLSSIPSELTGKNAATADKLKTARAIGGVSFDGTANIDLPGVNTAGNQNTSGSSASCTGNSATVAGIDPVNGNAGSVNAMSITSGSTWVIPSGTYMMISSSAVLEIYSGVSTIWSGSNQASGLIISDGNNYRLRANTVSTGLVVYRKLA